MPDRTEKPGGKADPKAESRARRAEALRRNLRRRKAQARARTESPPKPSDSDGKA